MSEAKGREEALDALLADTLLEGRPAPELLVRYADDPTRLSDQERADLEWHLANTPGCAAQLRLLRATDFDASPRRASTPPRRSRARLGWMSGLAAGVAVLAIVALRGARDAAPPVEVAVRREPVAPELPAPAVPESERETVSTPSAPSGEIATAERTPPAPAPPAPEQPGSTPRPEPPAPTPIVVALALPQYRAPVDAEPRSRRVGTLRGRTDLPAIRTLVPEHVARTLRPAPTLLWRLDALAPEGSRLEFSVTAPAAHEPLIREVLPRPATPGVQAIRLDTRGVTLPVDVECRWAIALRGDPEDPDTEVFAQGSVQRVTPTADLEARLAALDSRERPAALADAGLWSDALAELYELSVASPADEDAARALDSLLDQVGLGAR